MMATDPIRPQEAAPLQVVETEAALLGALMIDNRLLDRVGDIVTADDFFEPFFGRLYSLIEREVAQGRPANPVTLRPFVEADPTIAELGGPGYLARLTGSGAGLIGAIDFAKQIADFAKRRRLYDGLQGFLDAARDDLAKPVEALADGIDAALTAALQRHEVGKSFDIGKAWDVTMAEIAEEAAGDKPPGLAVDGLDDWNFLTGNVRRGEVVILAGRPSMGKSAVALSTAIASARAGWGTLFISLEMSVPELMKRAITDIIFDYGRSASFDNVKAGKLSVFDKERVAEARTAITSWPMVLRQDAGLKVGRLAMMIRRYKRQMAAKGHTLDIVFIDYLGLVKTDATKAKRYEEVSEVSRTIKQIARELDVAIVLLAQLNREVERREDKRPVLSDLRDSGEIEQDADVVLFVYREQYYLERAEPDRHDKKRADWETNMEACRDRVELIAAKVRNGRVGKRVCHFFAEHQAVRGSNFFTSRGQH
jgi:replicative DNA helicase